MLKAGFLPPERKGRQPGWVRRLRALALTANGLAERDPLGALKRFEVALDDQNSDAILMALAEVVFCAAWNNAGRVVKSSATKAGVPIETAIAVAVARYETRLSMAKDGRAGTPAGEERERLAVTRAAGGCRGDGHGATAIVTQGSAGY